MCEIIQVNVSDEMLLPLWVLILDKVSGNVAECYSKTNSAFEPTSLEEITASLSGMFSDMVVSLDSSDQFSEVRQILVNMGMDKCSLGILDAGDVFSTAAEAMINSVLIDVIVSHLDGHRPDGDV